MTDNKDPKDLKDFSVNPIEKKIDEAKILVVERYNDIMGKIHEEVEILKPLPLTLPVQIKIATLMDKQGELRALLDKVIVDIIAKFEEADLEGLSPQVVDDYVDQIIQKFYKTLQKKWDAYSAVFHEAHKKAPNKKKEKTPIKEKVPKKKKTPQKDKAPKKEKEKSPKKEKDPKEKKEKAPKKEITKKKRL